jgi:ubiquinone/menaquinone biosynthesis C-methylase UbiE
VSGRDTKHCASHPGKRFGNCSRLNELAGGGAGDVALMRTEQTDQQGEVVGVDANRAILDVVRWP